MSLANIRRLLQEDNILKLPGLAALSASQKRVVTIIGLESYAPEGNDTAKVVQLCMVHINTQGKIQWTQDTIAPGINLPSVWMKQHHLDNDQIVAKDNWVKGWAQALRHIATNNIVVLLNSQHELQILLKQYEHYGLKAPVFVNTMGIRDIFQMQHPTRSTTLHDIAAFYQVYLDPDKNLKNRTLTYVKLFEKMITEGLPVTELLTPAAQEEPIDIAKEMTLDDLRKYVRKMAASSPNALSFFDSLASQVKIKIAHNGKRMTGFSVMHDNNWVKGSELDPRLSWSQISQDQQWHVTEAELSAILNYNSTI